jgi:gamma-glutamylcyclotransferase (GGCT)/AIG2-like uncharacterized protein YtfP
MVEIFLSGGAMRGGPAHKYIEGSQFLGEKNTSPSYRLYEVRGRFPALCPVDANGVSIAGELFDVDMQVLRDRFLPKESPELELSIIGLDDGSPCLAMVLRTTDRGNPNFPDISSFGGWRQYRKLAPPVTGAPMKSPAGADYE